ncbi:hypothetical protein [Salinicola corii]|nr:hypothetical protein [Salinicola corii]
MKLSIRDIRRCQADRRAQMLTGKSPVDTLVPMTLRGCLGGSIFVPESRFWRHLGVVGMPVSLIGKSVRFGVRRIR